MNIASENDLKSDLAKEILNCTIDVINNIKLEETDVNVKDLAT